MNWLIGSLRINPTLALGPQRTDVVKSTPPSDGEKYLAKLTTLFPAEALALYGIAQGIFGSTGRSLAAAACACLLVLIFLRYQATKTSATSSPQWVAIVVAVVSFILWIITTGGSFNFISDAALPDGSQKWAAFLASAWTIVVPFIYKAEVRPAI